MHLQYCMLCGQKLIPGGACTGGLMIKVLVGNKHIRSALQIPCVCFSLIIILYATTRTTTMETCCRFWFRVYVLWQRWKYRTSGIRRDCSQRWMFELVRSTKLENPLPVRVQSANWGLARDFTTLL